jgi:tetratricopeptide (TPR) repeat protein
MKNFCGECGFRLDQEFKFCPNCGYELEGGSNSNKTSNGSKYEKFIVCENCGEDNLATNGNCSSCGVKLKGSIIEKGISKTESLRKRNKTKQQKNKDVAKEKIQAKGEKTLDNKKILLVSSAVIVLIVVLLVATGVIDSGLNQNQQQTSADIESGVNLSNLNQITELENTVKANPNDKVSLINLANLLQDSGLYDRAISYYKKYLELDPTDSNARVDMGICFYNVNDFQSAIAEMEAALKYQPNHQLAHLNLGIVNLTAGNVDVSKEWFRKAFEIDPNSQAGKRAQELLQSH